MEQRNGRWLAFDAETVTSWHRRNRTNKTGYLGVRWVSRDKRYAAYIRVHGRKEKLYVGSAKAAADAARKYDEKARELYGHSAVVNFEEGST